ncbi:hypothetical protein BJX64DRAFT_286114 [Aspergillus heterothallicus]
MTSLNVIIVGGGIGGLSAAIALRRGGHKTTVYEKKEFKGAAGSGIAVSPRAAELLRHLGIPFDKARLNPLHHFRLVRGDNLEVISATDPTSASTPENPQRMAHRWELHEALVQVAKDPSGPGIPCELIAPVGVTDFDPEAGSVTLVDGTVKTADLVIAADGVWSKAIDITQGHPCTITRTPTTTLHSQVPVKQIKEDPETAPLLELGEGTSTGSISPDQSHFFMRFWCEGDEFVSINLVTVWDVDLHTKGSEFKPTKHTLKERMSAFHSSLLKLVDMIPEDEVLPVWNFVKRDRGDKYNKGCLVGLGDAAHAMLPFTGHGACTAIQDAVALQVLLSELPSADKAVIEERLELYNKLQQPRGSVVQLYSDVPPWINSVGLQEEQALKYLPKEKLPKEQHDLGVWLEEFYVIEESKALLKEHLSKTSL